VTPDQIDSLAISRMIFHEVGSAEFSLSTPSLMRRRRSRSFSRPHTRHERVFSARAPTRRPLNGIVSPDVVYEGGVLVG